MRHKMRHLILLCVILTTSACSTLKQVEVPVYQSCTVEIPKQSLLCTDNASKSWNINKKMVCALNDIDVLKSDNEALNKALQLCKR